MSADPAARAGIEMANEESLQTGAEDLSVIGVDQTPRELVLPDAETSTDAAERALRLGDARSASDHYRSLAVGLAVTDVASILGALVVSYLLLFRSAGQLTNYALVAATAVALWVPLFHAFRLYTPHRLAPSEEFRRILSATGLGTVFLVIASYWWRPEFPRIWLGLTLVLALFGELGTRRLWHLYTWHLKNDGRLAFQTLLVGANDEAGRLVSTLSGPGAGFRAVGYVSPSSSSALHGLSRLGGMEDLERIVVDNSIECLFVASTAVGSSDMLAVVQVARRTGVEVRVSANLPDILTSRLTVQPVGDAMALSLKPVRLTGTQIALKRGFDIMVASTVLLITSPLLAVIAISVRASSRGPILFKQRRVTKGGHTFEMLKFRTMVMNGHTLIEERELDPSTPFFKLEDDPRLTRVGRLIRPLSLDELPQLFNVIRGDMSLVGPRPLPVEQVAANLEMLGPRHEVPAGMTGWWQVSGRSDLSIENALRMDLFYIENWSLTLDLFILLKTFGVILARRGAY